MLQTQHVVRIWIASEYQRGFENLQEGNNEAPNEQSCVHFLTNIPKHATNTALGYVFILYTSRIDAFFFFEATPQLETLKASALSGATLTSTNQMKHIAPRDDANNMALLNFRTLK